MLTATSGRAACAFSDSTSLIDEGGLRQEQSPAMLSVPIAKARSHTQWAADRSDITFECDATQIISPRFTRDFVETTDGRRDHTEDPNARRMSAYSA